MQEESLDTLIPTPDAEITHWAADNADHNGHTLDGSNQFHGMGIIAMSTMKAPKNYDHHVKHKAKVWMSESISNKGIPIIEYAGPNSPALSTQRFSSLVELKQPYIIPSLPYYANLIWQSAFIFDKQNKQMPNYSGLTQHFFRSYDDNTEKKSST